MRHLQLFLALLLLGCTPRGGPPPAVVEAATVVTVTIDPALDVLGALYESQGEALIAKATTREEANAALEDLDREWVDIWAAWASLKAAHDAWREAIEAGRMVEAAAYLKLVAEAWCDLLALVADRGGVLDGSQVPFACGPEPQARRWKRLPWAVAGEAIGGAW